MKILKVIIQKKYTPLIAIKNQYSSFNLAEYH